MVGHSFGGSGPALLAVNWAECGLTMLVLAARFYTQASGLSRLGWDLVWVSVATFLAIVALILLTLCTTYGIGNHTHDIRPQDIALGGELEWIYNIFTIMSTIFGKFAVVALLLSIHGQTLKSRRIFLLSVVGSAFVINCIQVILIFNQCTPIAGLWDHTVKADCHLLRPFLYTGTFQGSYSAFTDFVLAIYPIYFFWDLQINWKMKLGLISLFLGGTVAGVAAAIKTHNILALGSQEDETYAIKNLIFWTQAEMWLIIIMGSVPPLRPLVTKISRQVHSTVSGSRSRSYGPSHAKSPKASTKGSHVLQSIELGKMRPPFSRSSTENRFAFQGESDGFAILNKSAGDRRMSDEDQVGIKVTTDVTVNHDLDNSEQGSWKGESMRDIEHGGSADFSAHPTEIARPDFRF